MDDYGSSKRIFTRDVKPSNITFEGPTLFGWRVPCELGFWHSVASPGQALWLFIYFTTWWIISR